MNIRRGGWVSTFTGKTFWPIDPRPEEVCIEDIAHALSLVNRFNGHTRDAYSVAQHSYMASHIVPKDDAMAALLHDSSEAFISDVSRPVKPFLTGYKEIEDRLMQCIFTKFNLPWPMPASIKWADDVLVCTERRDLLNDGPDWGEWCNYVHLLESTIYPWTAKRAEELFLKRFEKLGGVR